MKADAQTTAAIRELIDRTYAVLSTPGADVASVFGAADITVAGSGQGELMHGPEEVALVAQHIASTAMQWVPEGVTVWCRGDVAWAQVLGVVRVPRPDGTEDVALLDDGRLRSHRRRMGVALLGRV
ncbi:hypothetical protein N802_13865 [Knoellia sinensis KCTC 19936]|uniref:SnoaL-like domain-containing protein n=1 Tax=Knoellia sinensis KCTC 19936 TaxID=1385520 RepID=A0A0A0J9E1_9MICO|nr:hypothetical protein [Knoellia sinensis]KGN33394.1 hypothetical protein N802_13865 [Knoellia sinensis KCTC 19936]